MPPGHGAPRPPPVRCFNEAAGADPADASAVRHSACDTGCFNEAAGADPADALEPAHVPDRRPAASMRPRGQTPRMLVSLSLVVGGIVMLQ